MNSLQQFPHLHLEGLGELRQRAQGRVVLPRLRPGQILAGDARIYHAAAKMKKENPSANQGFTEGCAMEIRSGRGAV